jgi:N-methylhydantoinase A
LEDGPLPGPWGVPAAIDDDPPSAGLHGASARGLHGASAAGLRDPGALRRAFGDAHEQRYGYRDEQSEVELVNMRVSVLGATPALRIGGAAQTAATRERTLVALAGEWVEAELWRGEPAAGTRVRGPALCAMPESTLLVPPGWAGEVDELGTVVLERLA